MSQPLSAALSADCACVCTPNTTLLLSCLYRESLVTETEPRIAINSNNNNNHIQRRYSRFFTISSKRRELSPTRALKWPGRSRVQITCKCPALITCKCHVTCHLVQRDSSAVKFDRVEITFISALFYWLNH